MNLQRRWLNGLLLLSLLFAPTWGGKSVNAQDYTIAGEWEITFEVVNGNPKATWIGRVWENNEGVETLFKEMAVDISDDCQIVGNPLFGEDDVTFDGIDDYVACEIPDYAMLFGDMHKMLVNCRCRFEGPPYASADISPVITTTAQPVIYHHRLHLEVLQMDEVADLALEKSVSNTLVQVGSQIAFSLTVTNQGPSDASNVKVDEKLPSGYTYVADDGGGSYDSETGIWSIGTITNGASATLQISVTVNESGDYSNFAEVVTSSDSDPDSIPGNGAMAEDDAAIAGINPDALFMHFPWVMTGAQESTTDVAAADAPLVPASPSPSAIHTNETYGVAQLMLRFVEDEQPIWQSHVFPVDQPDGVQLWAGYNAARYVEVNSPEGFTTFLSENGFWDAVQASFVEGFFIWESDAISTYTAEPMPSPFILASGTLVYIGHNPVAKSYFKGTVRAAAVDPGCRGH